LNPVTHALALSKARLLGARVKLLDGVPAQTPSVPAEIRAAVVLELAEAETLAGNPRQSLALIDSVNGQLSFGPFLRMQREQTRGNALLALNDPSAEVAFLEAIRDNERRLVHVASRIQRDAAFREIEGAYRGLVEIRLKQGKAAEA